MRRRTGGMAAAAALIGLAAAPALGSGGPEPTPYYIDARGGSPGELTRLYAGRAGVVMPASPVAILYLQWRLLHGLRVGEKAGSALSSPCCENPAAEWPHDGIHAWLEARGEVAGVSESPFYLPTERPGPDYTSTPNCFRDAFDTATATLRGRIAQHGKASPAVRAWLLTQDGVFAACGSAEATLPPPMPDAPTWLRADRAYQEAAFALYSDRNEEAAARFAAIAADASSPWRPMGLYLTARARQREALSRPSRGAFAQARAALAELVDAPAGTYGRREAWKMLRALAYRDRPARLLAKLDRELSQREPPPFIAISLRDFLGLAGKAKVKPDAADWIQTLQATERRPALDHAADRWRQSRDPAWLLAAMSLANPDDPEAEALAADAGGVPREHVAWPTVQYHLVRLTLARADPSESRARLDSILAADNLTRSERNLFSGARMQVAADLADFARHALRRPYCSAIYGDCLAEDWEADPRLTRLGPNGERVGLGADAEAIIDRLPLATRIALSRLRTLPAELRLDIALTSFARAVQLQDDPAIEGLAADLATLLPQMRGDWRVIVAARPGPARRFAQYFAMAKLPGLRTDFPAYLRPQGTVPAFRGYWVDWMIVPRGAGPAVGTPPPPTAYRYDAGWFEGARGDDLTCLGKCGAGGFPLRLPDFAAAGQDRALAEGAYFLVYPGLYPPSDPEAPVPPGSVSAWDEALGYARAHPRDARVPELLYRLIRVARWGGNHDQLGRRAFRLLHARYPNTVWAKRSPYYYD